MDSFARAGSCSSGRPAWGSPALLAQAVVRTGSTSVWSACWEGNVHFAPTAEDVDELVGLPQMRSDRLPVDEAHRHAGSNPDILTSDRAGPIAPAKAGLGEAGDRMHYGVLRMCYSFSHAGAIQAVFVLLPEGQKRRIRSFTPDQHPPLR